MSRGAVGAASGEYPPLELATVEIKSDGAISKFPALNKHWAPPSGSKWVEFYLPHPAADPPTIQQWVELMNLLQDDLRWLLSTQHHIFWSSLVHSQTLRDAVLASFCKSAPRTYDPNYGEYQQHDTIWPLYTQIHLLYFRIYMRIATFKESKENHITPTFWSKLVSDSGLLSLGVLQSLSTIYYSSSNPLFDKMVENVMRHNDALLKELATQIPILRDKFNLLATQSESLMGVGSDWDEIQLGDILWFTLDAIYSLLRLTQAHPPAAAVLLRYPQFLSSLTVSYEVNTRRWGRILSRLPQLGPSVTKCRTAILKLYRHILNSTTLQSVEASNDKRLDDFFEIFANSIDEKIFIHDYEKNFPFKADMQGLLSRGIFVDETRIDYMANAISACFHSCGEEYSVEKIVVDPLYDPNFDRQLLGACSLELGGDELESLVSQVKDLLPELPKSYLEAVLKHYGYKTENTINALLEGSVPSRLEKYKSEEYVRSQTVTPTHKPNTVGIQPVVLSGGEKFLPGKGSGSRPFNGEERLDSEAKSQIIRLVLESREAEKKYAPPPVDDSGDINKRNAYIDASLLPPTFSTDVDYEDDYDDTYDDVGAGMTEPDSAAVVFKPLNVRKAEIVRDQGGEDEEVKEAEGGKASRQQVDAFCEDPAIVRARLERKREEAYHKKHGGHPPAQQQQGASGGGGNRDVVGKAKGQGQDKDVVYNRRQKTMNKGAGGNFKKRADYKRKEF